MTKKESNYLMDILSILNEHYPICFDKLEQLRDAGSTSYAVFSGSSKFFLRTIKPAFFDTAAKGADVQTFLQDKGFPVPPVIRAVGGLPYCVTDGGLLILYEFIEGSESNPEQDAEVTGELIGRLHTAMKDYPGVLIKRDKQFYVGRFIDILVKKQYPKTDEFHAYGETLWERIKDLPQGYCHGDMYDGNIHKTPDGNYYVLDFDTSCEGIPMYDLTLICNKTHYFDYDESGYAKSKNVFMRLLKGYLKYGNLSQMEIDAFFDLIALYHFTLQATIIEVHGIDCVGNAFLDKQLDWLKRWQEQCARESVPLLGCF